MAGAETAASPERRRRRRSAASTWGVVGIPLIWGGLITGIVSIVLLVLQSRRGPRTFEFVIMGLLVIIAVGFTVGVFIAPPSPAGVLGGLVPRFEGATSVLLAASILGATIMPHAIYAHSALSRDRFATQRGEQAGGRAEGAWHGFGIRRGTDAATSGSPRSATMRSSR